MSEKLIRNDLLNEEYYEIDHSSGLKIFVMEKPDYSGAFAMFGTKYGSVDTCFLTLEIQEKRTYPVQFHRMSFGQIACHHFRDCI